MSRTELDTVKETIRKEWSARAGKKVTQYVGKFTDKTRIGKKVTAKVSGNYGTYTVSIELKGRETASACNCYIGKGGGCHHCHALTLTFLNDPDSFRLIRKKEVKELQSITDLPTFLQGTTLDSLLKDLKIHGITQKAFAESIGMNPRHLSSIKSSELSNRFYNELGATKLACLWVLDHFGKAK